MARLRVIKNILDADDVIEVTDFDDVRDAIMSVYDSLPKSAVLYNAIVGDDTKIPLADEYDVEDLQHYKDVVLVEYPEFWNLIALAVGSALLSILAVKVLAPSAVPQVLDNTSTSYGTPTLGERVNSPRIRQRIPDIYGKVRSVPDLLSKPLRVYEAGTEVEYNFLCIGRGVFNIYDMREGETPVDDIDGMSVEVWGPGSIIDPSREPDRMYGTAGRISRPLEVVRRVGSVIGQTLVPQNGRDFHSDVNVSGYAPGLVIANNEGGSYTLYHDFPTSDSKGGLDAGSSLLDYFKLGDTLSFDTTTSIRTGVFEFSAPSATLQPGSFEGSFPSSTDSDTWSISSRLAIKIDDATRFDTYVQPNEHYSISLPAVTSPQSGKLVNYSGLYTLVGKQDGWVVFEMWAPFYDLRVDAYLGAYTVGDPNKPTISVGAIRVDKWSSAYGGYTDPLPTFEVIGEADNGVLLKSNGGHVYNVHIGRPQVNVSNAYIAGPFRVTGRNNSSKVVINLYAPSGLYTDDGSNQTKLDVDVNISIYKVPSQGNWVMNDLVTVLGSSVRREPIGLTVEILIGEGERDVYLQRLTPTDFNFAGVVVDEIKIRDMYVVDPLSGQELAAVGNVTTLRSRTYAVQTPSAPKERKLNAKVARRLRYNFHDEQGEFYETPDVVTMFANMCEDPYLGDRSADDVKRYFMGYQISLRNQELDSIAPGAHNLLSFNYSFTDKNTSFEEMIDTLSKASLMRPYRDGSKLSWKYLGKTAEPKLVLTHRNKIPNSEKRTVSFGTVDDHDGIELGWTDNDTGEERTFTYPQTTVHPMRVDAAGVQTESHAKIIALREWNKLKFQRTFIEVEATQEASILTSGSLVLITDGTRYNPLDGEIVGVGLSDTLPNRIDTLYLSQPIPSTAPSGAEYLINFQLRNGTVATMVVSEMLNNPPRVKLETPIPTSDTESIPVTDRKAYARSGYSIDISGSATKKLFMVVDKTMISSHKVRLSLVNYTEEYYRGDADVINGLV